MSDLIDTQERLNVSICEKIRAHLTAGEYQFHIFQVELQGNLDVAIAYAKEALSVSGWERSSIKVAVEPESRRSAFFQFPFVHCIFHLRVRDDDRTPRVFTDDISVGIIERLEAGDKIDLLDHIEYINPRLQNVGLSAVSLISGYQRFLF